MKKILIFLLIFCLCGCKQSVSSKLEELGYSLSDIEVIESYSKEVQEIFSKGFNETYVELMHTNGFDIDKLDQYLKYYGKMDNEKIVSLINEHKDVDSLLELYTNEYYLPRYEQQYLDNLDNYENVRDCIEAVNTKTNYDYYENVIPTDMSKNYLILVNKYNALASDYEPDDLVDVDSHYGRGRTRTEVYEAYKALQDEANEKGYDFTICSAYRAYDYQKGLYDTYLENEGGNQAVVDTYSARPGHSEHQSGLCLDLYDSVYGMDNFGLSDASKWLNENCYRYGFIIRYTQDKEAITGYQAEPWQIRYVGSVDIAKDIMDRGITFDEYYACFVE